MYQHPQFPDLSAEVYHIKGEVFYVKIWFMGIKISGVTVRPSKKDEDLWVQMPMYRGRDGKFHRYVEFEDNYKRDARNLFEEVARKATANHQEVG